MIYAYDLAAQMPIMNLYDSQIMGMAISAAKDMYEKGQQEIKDFRKEYGDFLSPFAKDMARYKEIIGGVRDVINTAYNNGIDLTKSPEGRMILQNAINSVDPAEMQAMRANAKIGYAYQDAMQKLLAAGKYDPDMQAAFLYNQNAPSFEDFSTKDYGTWKFSSPIEATTLKDLTSSGFAHRTAHELTKEQAKKAMGDSYDPRAKYTGWVYDDLYNTAGSIIPGLRGDWRAEYFRNKSAQKVLALNPNATEADIDRLFQMDIADANRQWIIDPKGDLSDYYDLKKIELLRESNDIHRRNNSADNNSAQWSFEKIVNRSGQTAIVGKQVQEYTEGMLSDVIDEQLAFGKKVSEQYKSSRKSGAFSAFRSKYGQNQYRVTDIARYMESMGYTKVPNTVASFVIPKSRINKLSSLETLVSNTTGYRNSAIKTITDALKSADVVVYTPNGGSYLAFMKNDRNEAHFDGQVTLYKYKRDPEGNIVKNTKGTPLYDDEAIKTAHLYFDPDLKSVKNAPGTGSLRGPKHRIAVDTQDTRFQNAIISDKEVTDDIIKGTVYGSDAILSELPYYPNLD